MLVLCCMWECQKIQSLWKDIVNLIARVTAIDIPLDAKFCILGIYPDQFVPSLKAVPLINICLLQARRVIALRWKNTDGPTCNVDAGNGVLPRFVKINRCDQKESKYM